MEQINKHAVKKGVRKSAACSVTDGREGQCVNKRSLGGNTRPAGIAKMVDPKMFSFMLSTFYFKYKFYKFRFLVCLFFLSLGNKKLKRKMKEG